MSSSVLAEGHSIVGIAVLQEMVGVVTCPRLCQIAKEKPLWQFQCSVQEYGSKKKKKFALRSQVCTVTSIKDPTALGFEPLLLISCLLFVKDTVEILGSLMSTN